MRVFTKYVVFMLVAFQILFLSAIRVLLFLLREEQQAERDLEYDSGHFEGNKTHQLFIFVSVKARILFLSQIAYIFRDALTASTNANLYCRFNPLLANFTK